MGQCSSRGSVAARLRDRVGHRARVAPRTCCPENACLDIATEMTGITAVLLEVLPDPSLPKNGPGRWGGSGNFILDEFSLSVVPLAGHRPAETQLAFSRATADWEQKFYRAEHAIDHNPKTGLCSPGGGHPLARAHATDASAEH